MANQIAVIGYVRFVSESIKDILPHIKAMVDATRRLDGCISYDVAEDLFEPGLIRVSDALARPRKSTTPYAGGPHRALARCVPRLWLDREELHDLGRISGVPGERINHPSVMTINGSDGTPSKRKAP